LLPSKENNFHTHSEESIILRIALLGGFRVWIGSHLIPDEVWKRHKVQALIKLLALDSRHCLHREQLIDLLWPGIDIEAARNNLRQTLYLARKIFSSEPHSSCEILMDHNAWLSLAPEKQVRVDVEEFETAAATARRSKNPATYQAAIALYTGELLPEDRYEASVATRRESLRELHLSLLSELARLFEAQGDIEQATDIFHQILCVDPTAEESHRALMRIYAAAGYRHKALQQYHRLRKILRQELTLEPDQNSRSLYEAILSGSFQTELTHK
jgi:DNA-binding SARP family transcriptional activator